MSVSVRSKGGLEATLPVTSLSILAVFVKAKTSEGDWLSEDPTEGLTLEQEPRLSYSVRASVRVHETSE